MNRVYRIIWSKVRSCFVVVSELTKRYGKEKSAANAKTAGKEIFAGRSVLPKTTATLMLAGIFCFSATTVGATDWVYPFVTAETRILALGREQDGYNAFTFNSIDIGNVNTLSTEYAIAFGFQNTASGKHSVVAGLKNTASALDSMSVGTENKATNEKAIAVGAGNTAEGIRSIAIGYKSYAQGMDSIVIGSESKAAGAYTLALGYSDEATGLCGTAVGFNNTARLMDSAVGYENSALAEKSSAFGYKNSASGDSSSAIGYQNIASGQDSSAVGYDNKAEGASSSAFGIGNVVSGEGAVGFGYNNTATTETAIAMGHANFSTGETSVAIGNMNKASAKLSVAVGHNNIASGDKDVVAVGLENHATSNGAVAIGDYNKATGGSTVVMGRENLASGLYSVALGGSNEVRDADLSAAVGYHIRVDAKSAYAFGGNLYLTPDAKDTVALAGHSDDYINYLKISTPNSVILGTNTNGQGSVHTGDIAKKITINGTDYAFGGGEAKTDSGLVSVGHAGAERQIQYVAAGDVSPTSTDAVNGSQLYAVAQAIGAADSGLSDRIGTISQDGAVVQASNNVSQNLTALDNALDNAKKTAEETKTDLQLIAGVSGIELEAISDLAKEIDERTEDIETIKAMDGKVAAKGESRADEFVKGSTVYEEVRPADGTYVKEKNTTAANLAALDTAVTAKADKATTLGGYGIRDAYTQKEVDAKDTALSNRIGTINEDGMVIKADENLAENLTALDEQAKMTADAVASNTERITENSKNIAQNTQDIATNAGNIATAQETADTAVHGVSALLVGTGINIEGIIATDVKVDELAAQEGEIIAQGEKADEFVRGATVYEYLNGKPGEGGSLRLGENVAKIAVGNGSEAIGEQSIAIGYGIKVHGNRSGAIGDPGDVFGDGSYVIGNNPNVNGNGTFVAGNDASVTGDKNFVLGHSDNVTGKNNIVLGSNVTADVDDAIVLGNKSKAEANAVSVGSPGEERQIKHVADGEDDTDAVNKRQLDTAIENAVGDNMVTVNNHINRLDNRIDKVGAGAAALAALHPLDTDDKFTMGMGYGHYHGANAMAMGMFYRPTETMMCSVGGAFGNGENMVNVGLSFALGQGKGFRTSKAAMARKIAAQGEEIQALKAENAAMKEQNAKLEARLAAIEAKLGK